MEVYKPLHLRTKTAFTDNSDRGFLFLCLGCGVYCGLIELGDFEVSFTVGVVMSSWTETKSSIGQSFILAPFYPAWMYIPAH